MTNFELATYWSNLGEFDIDLNYPCCFACKGPFITRWDTSTLQKAHLIARVSGGSVDPSNLVLLCIRCHREAPMIGTSVEFMKEWVQKRDSYASYLIGRIHMELSNLETLPDILDCISNIKSTSVTKLILAKAEELHIEKHSGGDAIAAMVIALQEVCKQQYCTYLGEVY